MGTSSKPRVSSSVGVRLIFAGFAVFGAFIGLANLASIASRHGFEWHADIKGLVDGYRDTFYPIYEFCFGWLSKIVHIRLSPEVKDAVTVALLAFSAANTESAIRDGRPLVAGIFAAFANLFSTDGDGPRPSPGIYGRALGLLEGWSLLCFLASAIATWVLIYFFFPFHWLLKSFWMDFVWIDYVGVPWPSKTVAYWWLGLGIPVGILFAVVGGLAFSAIRKWDIFSIVPAAFGVACLVLALASIAAVVGLVFEIVLPVLLAFFLVAVGIFLVASILSIALISPVVAWRTVAVTVLLFLSMMAIDAYLLT